MDSAISGNLIGQATCIDKRNQQGYQLGAKTQDRGKPWLGTRKRPMLIDEAGLNEQLLRQSAPII